MNHSDFDYCAEYSTGELIENAKRPFYDLDYPENRIASTWNGEGTQNSLEWIGVRTMAEAVELAESGWSDAPDLSEHSRAIRLQCEQPDHFEMERQVTGAFVDIGAYLEGVPENMCQFVDSHSPKIFRLGVPINARAKVTKESMALRGAVALALADAITSSGNHCEIVGFAFTAHYWKREKPWMSMIEIPLKASTDLADPDKLAFWTCHAAAFRKLVFRQQEARGREYIRNMGIYCRTSKGMRSGAYGGSLYPDKFDGIDLMVSALPASPGLAAEIFKAYLNQLEAPAMA